METKETNFTNEENEFSVDSFFEYFKIKLSKPRLAKNYNWYRKGPVNDDFWDWYNGETDDPAYRQKQKDFLKQHGISLYKEFGEYGLFDWNFKERGTKEEYEAQQESRSKGLRELLLIRLTEQATSESPNVFDTIKKEMEHCKTAEDLIDYAEHEIVNGEYICKQAQHEYSLL